LLEGFYFTCLKINKTPEDFQVSVMREWLNVAEQKSSEYALGIILEFLPSAKTNPSAYLHAVLEKQAAPSLSSIEAAKQLSETIREVVKQIGTHILPKDWTQAAGKLGIRVKPGTPDELSKQQAAILERLEQFRSNFI
jgi:hypothetical protein